MLTTPLAPGNSLIFMLELGPATSYADPTWVPGYKNVFYNTADPSKNAEFTVTYDPPGGPTSTVSQTLPALASSDPLASVTNCSGLTTTVTTTGMGTSVPEPSSLVLLLLGGIPIWFAARRNRVRALQAAM